MVTPVEKRSSNKFCDFHNDKGHSTDECMQLKKQIEELVRAGKLSHLIKEIKQGRDQSKTGKKETAVKDNPTTIYMAPSDHRRRHSLHQSMDELHDCKIVVTLQRYHRTTGVKSNSSSTIHGSSFPVEGGIVTIRSIILIPTECASVITSSVVSNEERTRPANFKVVLHPDFPDQEVAIGGTLSDKGRTELCSILKKNLDIFAWQPSDMTGVPQSVAEHRHNIREGYSLVRQKKRGQALERAKAIQAEVQKLVEAGIMREVYYHDWLSNPVMVKKHNGSWRMCVDFTDLNKACPQDCYPLPEIDWNVESLCGYPFKCFLDAYKGYHQIQLAEGDEEKTTFHTGQGCGPNNRTRNGPNANLVYKPCVTGSGTKLLSDGETGLVTSLRGKKTPTVFSGTSYHGHYRQPIKKVMARPDVAGRLQKWSIMLGEHNITNRPRTSVKGQILADFLIKMPDEYSQAVPATETQEELWTLFTDGSSCVDGSGAGLILTSPEGVEFTYALRFQFTASNNEAGYEALVAGLRIAARMGVKNVQVSVDSKLVSKKVLGTYVAKKDNMVKEGCGNGNRRGQTDLDDADRRLFKRMNSPRRQDGGTKAPPQGPTIRFNGGNSLQTVVPYAVVKMRRTAPGGGEIVSDNDKQFCDNPFKDWRDKLNITQRFASVKHPQSNGLVERANRIIPTEIGMPTYRTAAVDMVSNDEELRLNLDLLEERRERAAICEAKAKLKMMKYYNAWVRSVAFKPCDFVYRNNDASHAVAGGKLGQK
uniref:Reverse transcriptase domain-containing protein n=1 Tax=Tanacetum cinerariifolium TaxID=118510 RepID=A0A6L2L596_TANCI|nr:reverse transcriptase domain-containing protein [Tanacetum cinerariifolium]